MALEANGALTEMPRQETDEQQWYVIHTYSGYENKVKANLEKRVSSMNMGDKIFRIVVPMEDEFQIKEGKKKITKRKIYPGYVLVEMVLTDASWYVVRNTPGVTGFVGSGAKPIALLPGEVRQMLREPGTVDTRPRISLEVGESVRVTGGPFQNFIGSVEEVQSDKGKVKVLVSMFGRETPVELDFAQIEKAE